MSLKDTYTSAWEVLPVTITNGTALSDIINLGGLRLFAIVMPSAWTAAGLTFQMSPDAGASWANIKDQSGTELNLTAGASDCIVVDHTKFAALQYLHVRSGTAATPVAQAADRTLQLILRTV